QGFNRACHGTDQAAVVWSSSSNHDALALGLERAPELRQRLSSNVVEDQVVAWPILRKIFLRIIDHVICANGSNEIEIARTADAGHVRAVRFRKLHCEGADTA